MFDSIMNFIVNIIFWSCLILFGIGLLFLPFLKLLSSSLSKNKKSKSKSTYKTKNNKNVLNNKKTSNRLPGVHEDYDEELQKELIKEEKYDLYNFEEEDLEEDDYHFEDDK